MTIKNYSKQCLMISAGIMVLALLLSLFGMGINVGIDFSGGMSMQYTMGEAVTQSDIEGVLNGIGLKDYAVSVQGTGKDSINIRIKAIDEDGVQGVQASITEALQAKYPNAAIYGDVNYVGPVAGATLLRNAFLSVLIAALCMLIYIAIRFEYKMGVMAIVALFHDLILVVGIYALVGREVNPNTIAALLTILGYSLYDTVVVFHRINDNMKGEDIRCTFMTMANHSMNQVFIRTINTTLTSFIPVFAMLLFGGETLKDFAFAMVIGLVCGSYSSIAVATPLFALWKTREPRYAKLQKKFGPEIGRFEFGKPNALASAAVPKKAADPASIAEEASKSSVAADSSAATYAQSASEGSERGSKGAVKPPKAKRKKRPDKK